MEPKLSGQEEQFQNLERDAFRFAAEGKFGRALEKLDMAMKLKTLWYHVFYKVVWLYSTNDTNKQNDAAKLIDDAVINFEKEEQFYFLCLRAEFRFKLAIKAAATATLSGIDNAVKQLQLAFSETDRAQYLLLQNKIKVDELRKNIPEDLRNTFPVFLNLDDLSGHLRTLHSSIEVIRHSLLLFKLMAETEKRVNAEIEATKSRIESERVRTIELLGIFTAIFAFIFAGVQIFTRVSLLEGLVLQSGMALVMIIFFLGFHMVIEPKARTALLKGTLIVLLLGLLFGLPLYAKYLQDTPITKSEMVNPVQHQRVEPNIIQDVNNKK